MTDTQQTFFKLDSKYKKLIFSAITLIFIAVIVVLVFQKSYSPEGSFCNCIKDKYLSADKLIKDIVKHPTPGVTTSSINQALLRDAQKCATEYGYTLPNSPVASFNASLNNLCKEYPFWTKDVSDTTVN